MLSDDGRVFYFDSEPFFDLDSQSALLNQSHMSQPNLAEGGRVQLQQVKILIETQPASESLRISSEVNWEVHNDRIKDIGVTANGLLAVNEKGEVYLVHTQSSAILREQAPLEDRDLLSSLFKLNRIVELDRGAEEHIASRRNSLDHLDMNMRMGDQFDSDLQDFQS